MMDPFPNVKTLPMVDKKVLFTLKFNRSSYRHIKCHVTTTYYFKNNSNYEKGSKIRPRNPNLDPTVMIYPKRR